MAARKPNLLDPKKEPSDVALRSIMVSVRETAHLKREIADKKLFDTLQLQAQAVRKHYGLASQPVVAQAFSQAA